MLRASTFGLPTRSPIMWALFAAVVASYFVGWIWEDPTYWLANEAILLWAGAVPLFLGCTGFAWQLGRPAWGRGLWFALPFFLIHLIVMWSVSGRFNDDYLGIAALFAGIALAGWWIGRGLHIAVVNRRRHISV